MESYKRKLRQKVVKFQMEFCNIKNEGRAIEMLGIQGNVVDYTSFVL